MGVWQATSKRKIFDGPDRDETTSDKRNLAMYNVLFTHTGNYATHGGTAADLSATFQDIHCVIQCGVGPKDGGNIDNGWGARTWQPIVTSKNTVAFKGYNVDDDAETNDASDIDDTIYCLVIGIPAVTVPKSVDSVDAFA